MINFMLAFRLIMNYSTVAERKRTANDTAMHSVALLRGQGTLILIIICFSFSIFLFLTQRYQNNNV